MEADRGFATRLLVLYSTTKLDRGVLMFRIFRIGWSEKTNRFGPMKTRLPQRYVRSYGTDAALQHATSSPICGANQRFLFEVFPPEVCVAGGFLHRAG